MRGTLYFMLGLFLAAIAVWYGDELLSGKITLPELPTQSPAQSAEPKTVYKWQDEHGNWQFSDKPRPDGRYQTQTIEPINTVEAVKEQPKPTPAQNADTKATVDVNPLLPITDPGKVKQLVEDAQNVQQLLDDRNAAIEQRLK